MKHHGWIVYRADGKLGEGVFVREELNVQQLVACANSERADVTFYPVYVPCL